MCTTMLEDSQEQRLCCSFISVFPLYYCQCHCQKISDSDIVWFGFLGKIRRRHRSGLVGVPGHVDHGVTGCMDREWAGQAGQRTARNPSRESPGCGAKAVLPRLREASSTSGSRRPCPWSSELAGTADVASATRILCFAPLPAPGTGWQL